MMARVYLVVLRACLVLAVCLAHNLREGNEAHRHRHPIDPARTGANEVLRGPASLPVAVELVRNVFDELGIVPARADAIAGVELVFQPPDGSDTPAFWSECLRWVDGRYQHVLSAVVHRDQKRPHLHVIALAVAGGKLAGHALTSGVNLLQRQRREFMAHMFATLGLRPNRRAADPLKALALSAGKGAKTAAGAARRDAELTRKAGTDWKRATAMHTKKADRLIAQCFSSPKPSRKTARKRLFSGNRQPCR